jgi:UDP-glucose 4-epimerase
VLLGGRFYVSLSDHDPQVQFTWIDDAIAAFAAALHVRDASGVFNVGAPGTVRASEVAGILGARGVRLPHRVRRAVAASATRLRVPGALHPGFVDMDRYPIVLDSARAERELGWAARHDTRGALERLRETMAGSAEQR